MDYGTNFIRLVGDFDALQSVSAHGLFFISIMTICPMMELEEDIPCHMSMDIDWKADFWEVGC